MLLLLFLVELVTLFKSNKIEMELIIQLVSPSC